MLNVEREKSKMIVHVSVRKYKRYALSPLRLVLDADREPRVKMQIADQSRANRSVKSRLT